MTTEANSDRRTKSGVRYDVLGEVDQPPVVFVHGWAGESGQLRDVAERLPTRCRMVLIDLPGHGASNRMGGAHTVERYSGAVAEVLDGEGIEQAVFVGHSAGAAVCVETAVARPELVAEILALDSLAVPTLYPAHDTWAARRHQLNVLLSYRRYTEKLVDGLTEMATTQAWRADLVRQLVRTPRRVAASFMRSLVAWDRDRALRATNVPITLLPATLGTPPREVPILVERCRLRASIEGHHFHVLDRPAETAEAVARALAANGQGT